MGNNNTKIEVIITKAQKYLSEQPDVVAAYLFGSAALGRLHPSSDIDFAVLFSPTFATQTARFERRLELAIALEQLLKCPVEIVDIEGAPPFLFHQIRKNGKLIVDKGPQRRKTLEVAARRHYLDMLPFYRIRARTALERFGK